MSGTRPLFTCEIYESDVRPSGKITTVEATFSDYDAIDASSAFTVYLSFSDTDETIEIEANENLHEYIEVKKENGTLVIGVANNVRIRGKSTLNAYITTKSISSFSASGASRFVIEDVVDQDRAHIYLYGVSSFNGALDVDLLFADISGASVMNITGSCNDFEFEASGASVLRDYTFSTNTIKAELSGASHAALTVDQEIDVEASGASILRYRGDAVITNQDLSGASSVKKM